MGHYSGTTQSLRYALNEAHQNIQSETLPLTIGNISQLYENGGITLPKGEDTAHNWDTAQKTHAIEKILLGLPAPQIVAFQYPYPREEWEIIGGAQWVSAVLQFQGLLGDGFKLKGTKILKDAEGLGWNEDIFSSAVAEGLLPVEQCHDFMQTKIFLTVVAIYDYPDIREWYKQDMLNARNS